MLKARTEAQKQSPQTIAYGKPLATASAAPDGESSPSLLRPRDAAKWLAVSERTLWAISAPRGPLPVVRLGTKPGGPCRYRLIDLQQYVAGLAAQSLAAAAHVATN